MTIIRSYQNGNTQVSIFTDGTKVRQYEGEPRPVFPETLDIKITNRCDLGCSYCHEKSVPRGRHASLGFMTRVLKNLPPGVELAIGGGNPLSHPGLLPFLQDNARRGFISNLTVNYAHLGENLQFLKTLIEQKLIMGLGVSIQKVTSDQLKLKDITSNGVYHIIAGMTPITLIHDIIEREPEAKILILGYKKFGRGADTFTPQVQEQIEDWSRYIVRYIKVAYLSFDNLAIEQLSIKRLFTESGWDKVYMGDDFTFSMYVDAVNQEFAPTSRSTQRVSYKNIGLIEFFQNNRGTGFYH